MDAWNRHDVHAFAALLTEDAEFTNVRGTHTHGRAEVEEFHAPMFATIFKGAIRPANCVAPDFLKPGCGHRRYRLGNDGSGHSRRRCPTAKGIT